MLHDGARRPKLGRGACPLRGPWTQVATLAVEQRTLDEPVGALGEDQCHGKGDGCHDHCRALVMPPMRNGSDNSTRTGQCHR